MILLKRLYQKKKRKRERERGNSRWKKKNDIEKINGVINNTNLIKRTDIERDFKRMISKIKTIKEKNYDEERRNEVWNNFLLNAIEKKGDEW